jgi:hypothetical protein
MTPQGSLVLAQDGDHRTDTFHLAWVSVRVLAPAVLALT